LIAEIKQKKQTEETAKRQGSLSTTETDADRVNATMSRELTRDTLPLPKKEEMTNDDGKEKTKKKTEEEEEMETEEKETEECPICLEDLPNFSTQFTRFTCCGKGIHTHCNKDRHNMKMGGTCPFCRAKSPTSQEEVVKYLRPWVKKKKAWAQHYMGQMYDRGEGVKQSYEMARRLYEQAAQQGVASAMFNLGMMYHQGEGVEQSNEKAAEYFEQAADLGDADAQHNLGNMYNNGWGVEHSYEKAFEYYEQAAHLGFAEAQYNVGRMYATGEGVSKNETKAHALWTLAAAQGHKQAINMLPILEKNMTKS
jgi:hypothetical protein